MKFEWTQEDAVTLRGLLKKIPEEKLRYLFENGCPSKIDRQTVIECDSDKIKNLSLVKAGWDEAVNFLFTLAKHQPAQELPSGHEDMS